MPYLRGVSSDSKIWGFLACGAGCILGGFSLYLHPGLFFTASALMFGAGIWFFVRGEIRQYWPVAALSIAVILVAVTKMTLSANFLEVQQRARVLIQEPLTKFSPSAPISNETVDDLVKEFQKRITEPEGFLRHEVESLEKELQERTEVVREETVAIPRKRASNKSPEPPLTLSQYATLSELHDKNVEATQRWEELTKKIGADLNHDVGDLAQLQKQVHDMQELDGLLSKWMERFRNDLIERFELCVMCSLGFWATLGALGGWALRRGRHSDETAQNRATTDPG